MCQLNIILVCFWNVGVALHLLCKFASAKQKVSSWTNSWGKTCDNYGGRCSAGLRKAFAPLCQENCDGRCSCCGFDSCFRCVLVGNIGTRCERMRATLAVINMQLRCMVELLWPSLDNLTMSQILETLYFQLPPSPASSSWTSRRSWWAWDAAFRWRPKVTPLDPTVTPKERPAVVRFWWYYTLHRVLAKRSGQRRMPLKFLDLVLKARRWRGCREDNETSHFHTFPVYFYATPLRHQHLYNPEKTTNVLQMFQRKGGPITHACFHDRVSIESPSCSPLEGWISLQVSLNADRRGRTVRSVDSWKSGVFEAQSSTAEAAAGPQSSFAKCLMYANVVSGFGTPLLCSFVLPFECTWNYDQLPLGIKMN